MKNYRYLLLILFGASFAFNPVYAADADTLLSAASADRSNEEGDFDYMGTNYYLFPDLPILTDESLGNILLNADDLATQQPETVSTTPATLADTQIAMQAIR